MNDDELARQLRAWSSGPSSSSAAGPTTGPEVVAETLSTIEMPGDRDPIPSLRVVSAVHERSQHRWLARAAIVLLVVALAGGTAVVASRQSQDLSVASSSTESSLPSEVEFRGGPCPKPEARPAGDDLTAFVERSNQQYEESQEEARRTGFLKMSGPDANSDGWVCGWTKVTGTDPTATPEFVPGGGNPLYDNVNGNLMGYLYPYLGFYTVEEASAPGFDPVALRTDENGCDPLTSNC